MQQAFTPYATAGVAIVGAGLIAVTPVLVPSPDVLAFRDVALTAGGLSDLTAPWESVFGTAQQNATTLIDNFNLAPAVGLQQFIANQAEFFHQLAEDPSQITTIAQQMQENLDAVLTGFGLSNPTGDTLTTVTDHTLSNGFDFANGIVGHAPVVTQLLPMFLPPDQAATIVPLLNFMSSPMSAIMIGALGPAISPLVALGNSIADGDGLNETLANTVGAFFNGATLNLDALLPMINDSGMLPFPAGIGLSHLDIAFGGLLSTGTVGVGPYQVLDDAGNVIHEVPAVGGSIFNSVGLGLDLREMLGMELNIPSAGIGPIGAMLAWDQTVGALLGSGWDGKGAIPVTPPLDGADLPMVPTDFVVDGEAGSGVAELLAVLGG